MRSDIARGIPVVLLLAALFAYRGVLYWWCRFYHMVPRRPISSSRGAIPAILYKQGETDNLPEPIVELYRTIESENPSYRVVYFSDRTRRQFIAERLEGTFSGVLAAYDRLIVGAYRADLFRLCVLFANGGVYGDFSQQYLAPLDSLVDRRRDELVLTLDAPKPRRMEWPPYSGISNGFLASRPGHPFVAHCIRQIVENVQKSYYGSSSLDPSGPSLLRDVLCRHPETRYRMDVAKLFHGKGSCSMYYQRLGTHERVIQHKLPGHYALMKTAGEHYDIAWRHRRMYRP